MALQMDLPWPPSINHYIRRTKFGKPYVSAEGKAYNEHVGLLMRMARVKPIEGPVAFKVRLHPPNHRRRDLDNCLKVLIDAVANGGAMADDFQIKHIEATMLEVVKDGSASVTIEAISDKGESA